jgi:nucleolar complex protein 3
VHSDNVPRTVKETKRIHELEKSRDAFPKKNKKKEASPDLSDISDYDFDSEVDFSDDDLSGAGLGSDDDDDDSDDDGSDSGSDDPDQSYLNDGFDDISTADESESEDEAPRKRKKQVEEEAEYETAGRTRWAEKEEEDKDSMEVGRLPIKLPTGEVQLVEGSTRIAIPKEKKKPVRAPIVEAEESDAESEASDTGAEATRIAGQPGRFGRMNVAEIVSAKGWKNAQRLAAAKEQMAEIGAEVLSGGELIDVCPIITRLSTWALPTVPNPDTDSDVKNLPVPNSIRAMALLSQLAVFKDLIPGYRIRQLTAQEEAEKVRDEVRRMREGEKILVRNYKSYLKTLETEVKSEYNPR